MRLVLSYNLRRSDREEEAEFDTRETISIIARILRRLGHVVTPVDVSCSIPHLASRLRRLRPDLVFNMAEGRRGRFREAFYPALFEQLGVPHTGSNASVLALCLDKVLTKRVVGAAGVAVPRDRIVRRLDDLDGGFALTAPVVIVKPNYEGSSMGITQASVVEGPDPSALRDVVRSALERYPEGVLVEEYIDGADVSVGWVEGFGVLPTIRYDYEPGGKHRIMDLALKQGPPIPFSIPASLDDATQRRLIRAGELAFAALGVRGYGRADFRITPSGEVVFLEMNPLPSLSPSDEELYLAAACMGKSREDMFGRIIAAAVESGDRPS